MLLSLIIPVFNSSRFLRQCLESIVVQLTDDVEVILVDDGSTDSSPEICSIFCEKNFHIRYYKKENKGVSSARNYGISKASGKYICFIDSDDYIDENYIQKLKMYVGKGDLVLFGYTKYSLKKSIVYSCYSFRGNKREFYQSIQRFLSPPYLLSPWAKIFKRDLIECYRIYFLEEMSYAEDVFFVLNYLKYSQSIATFQYAGYIYRVNDGDSLSSNINLNQLKNDMTVNEMLFSQLCECGISRASNIRFYLTKKSILLFCDKIFRSNMKFEKKCRVISENIKELCNIFQKSFFYLIFFRIMSNRIFVALFYLLKKMRSLLK